jgi:hypothetical protein
MIAPLGTRFDPFGVLTLDKHALEGAIGGLVVSLLILAACWIWG